MLLDTSGLLCCFDANEVRHHEAVNHYGNASLRLTHNYVLAEFVALAQARGLPREASLTFSEQILADSDVNVIWVDPILHNEAMQLSERNWINRFRCAMPSVSSLCNSMRFSMR